jgi:hypothetical protein
MLVSFSSSDALFTRLFDSKFDPAMWSQMSIRDAFEYDSKVFQRNGYRIGWSAVLTHLDRYRSQPSFNDTLKSYCKENQLDAFVFSSVLPQGSPKREILFCSFNEALDKPLDSAGQLLKERFHACGKDCFFTTDDPVSRKALAPLLLDLLSWVV